MEETPMEPYQNFLIALLQQAIKDASSPLTEQGQAAWRWLRSDPACVEICDWLEMDQSSLIAALEQRQTSPA